MKSSKVPSGKSRKSKLKLTQDHLWAAVFVAAIGGVGAILVYVLDDGDIHVMEPAAYGNPPW